VTTIALGLNRQHHFASRWQALKTNENLPHARVESAALSWEAAWLSEAPFHHTSKAEQTSEEQGKAGRFGGRVDRNWSYYHSAAASRRTVDGVCHFSGSRRGRT
jgi:hypothetical protein